ncbi:MAG: ubiquinone/menaquinone biosynthesis methyltransferase [Chthonomonadales bacterium]|nr:ubiquinone/menaquinone biosynthesis methyltransferase [Chthonomonadales bacterium]
MFSGIADRYDLLNTLMSLSRHRAWRRAAVAQAEVRPGDAVLDVCAGTGDFAIEASRAAGPSGIVVASDFCLPMLARTPGKALAKAAAPVTCVVADALRLPFAAASVDRVTVGFGIRNVADTGQAFREMARVLRPGGRAVCLEFAVPSNRLVRWAVRCYEATLPALGGLLSTREAYAYLPASIEAFHSREELAAIMREAGFRQVRLRDLNLGSVCIHTGVKP